MADEKHSSQDDWALVVDDHPLFSDALVLTLQSFAEYSTIRTAENISAALDILKKHLPPKTIILDLDLPDVTGLDGLLRIQSAAQGVAVVIVSSVTEDRVIKSALKAGAAGFVPKHSSRNIIREALASIEAGEVYLPEGYVEPHGNDEQPEALRRIASLTNQQARILDLICEGKLNKQIAFELSIAEATVKAHMTAIMRKLGVQSRTQAVLAAQQARLQSDLPNPK